ncbi:ATPase [Vallitalea pronyensis]|uniref:ATPase n=1 Tax=Vallitalea pronyensis TaxID=1348613 RepID=A0A8J8SIQ2_9FIRM|nr:ATP synthase subunit C [Vallitalea pronyensis]QUI24748.1 ATPase [Vallitalea pronyensis]
MDIVMILVLLLVGVTIGTGVYAIKKGISGSSVRTILGVNILSFFGVLIVSTVILLTGGTTALAAAPAEAVAASGEGLRYIAAALSTGLAAIGSGIAVAVSGSAAIGAISEDSKLLGKTVIFVGLAEGIAIYGLIISILILG